MPTFLNFAHTHGPDTVFFELTSAIEQGGSATAKIVEYDAVTKTIVLTDAVVKVLDILYRTIEGDSGERGYGMVVDRLPDDDVPIVIPLGLGCTLG